jgi:hypothetical protein
MEIIIVNPIDYPGWDEQILRLPGATFFHSAAWAKVLADSYGYNPLYFVAHDGGTICGCLPVMEVDSFLTGRRGVSLPFTDFCQPLTANDHQFAALLNRAVDHGRARGWKSLELRGGEEFLTGISPSSSYFLHTLSLQPSTFNLQQVSPQPSLPFPVCNSKSLPAPFGGDAVPAPNPQPATRNPQQILASFRESTRRNIRKASGSGVSLQIMTTEESVRQFCRLNQVTRRDHGLPPQPHRFFEEVYDHIISKGFGFVVIAFCDERPIAGSIYFHLGRTAIYKYGASHKAWQHLRANNLVMWEAINWYAANGYEMLSFGRTDLHHDGLRQFKMGWGVAEEPLRYYRYSMKTNRFVCDAEKTSEMSGKVVSMVPLPILRAVGAVLYRHIG